MEKPIYLTPICQFTNSQASKTLQQFLFPVKGGQCTLLYPMIAFNIDINHGEKSITLTIIPKEDYFKIAYAEGILGAIKKQGADWFLMEPEDNEPGVLAPFENKLTPEANHIMLGTAEINQIAGEIENHLK